MSFSNKQKRRSQRLTLLVGQELLDRGYLLLDVREPDEYEQGAIANSIHIPRGQIESSIENRLPDRQTKLVVMCAGGVRSAFAVQTLEQLGYDNSVSMDGGFNKWKDEGRPWSRPRTLTPEQRSRYQRHLLVPEVGEEGQLKLLNSKVLLLGAGGLGSPAAMYLAAAGVGTLGIIDMDVVDESNLQRQILHNTDRIGSARLTPPRKRSPASTPMSMWSPTTSASVLTTSWRFWRVTTS